MVQAVKLTCQKLTHYKKIQTVPPPSEKPFDKTFTTRRIVGLYEEKPNQSELGIRRKGFSRRG